MRCANCGKDFNAGLAQCPHCQSPVHYGGNTEFYNQARQNSLSIKDFFVNVFSTQPPGVGDKMFASGTAQTTPTPDRMLQEWNKPWLYARILLVGLLFNFLCYVLFAKQDIPAGMYAFLSFGCMVTPLAVLVFYWEINIPRDIPFYRVLLIFFVGGMLSLIFTLLLPQTGGPAYLAPLTEEPGKVLAVAIFVYWLSPRYIFGGLLIGAAVGAGFTVFENIQYVMNVGIGSMIQVLVAILQGKFSPPVQNDAELTNFLFNVMFKNGSDLLIMRSMHAIGTHTAWAAIEGGALVLAKGKEDLQLKHFFDPRFLAYLGASMFMHFAWNYSYKLHEMPYVGDAKFLLLSLIAAGVACTLIQRGVVQVLDVVNATGAPLPPATAGGLMLQATTGPLVNALFPVNQRITVGRDPAQCNVVFPANTPGISRRHCVLEPHSGEIYLMDLGSTAGTFLQGGQRLQANQWTKLTGNFYLGSTNAMFAVNRGGNQPPLPPQAAPPILPPNPTPNGISISGIAGPLQGSNFSDGQRLIIGRDPAQCNVVFPANTPGVSRRHCMLERRPDGVYIMDVGSTAGTFLQGGQRLPVNQWTKISGNFYLGSPNAMFRVN